MDRAVVDKVLETIHPVGIEAAIRMSECAHAEDAKSEKLWSWLSSELVLKRTEHGGSSMPWSRKSSGSGRTGESME